MTEKHKRRLLRHLKCKNLTRKQIEKYCSGKTPFDRDSEINSLCSEKMIHMVSDPVLETGVFIPSLGDIFELSDTGKDYLSNNMKERIRFYLPIVISFAALIVSIIALLK